ncbi:MAG: ribonuclease HII [Bacillota bacterium]|nr:ribonuclease HII [Bacillota bacterium]
MAEFHLKGRDNVDTLEKSRLLGMMEIENKYAIEGYKLIAGVDEAGRGPLAGPVYASAVILPADCFIEGLNDSKKLSPKMRESLFEIIKDTALCYGIAFASVEEIERYNILNATFLAMRRAINMLDPAPDFVIVDGNQNIRELKVKQQPIVKGDSKSQSIAAASILAKVSRDRYMIDIAKEFPEYNFEVHKGYGTKMHTDLIKQHGPSKIHRLSFLKNIVK